MKKLSSLFLVLPFMVIAQVGINTTTPTKTLDVNGEARIRNTPTATGSYSVLVVDSDGNVKKIPVSALQTPSGTCPNLNRFTSHGYSLNFYSYSSVPNPGNSLTINGLNFVSSSSFILGNVYYFSWTNTSGTALNLNTTFSVNFSGLVCTYVP